MADSTTKLRNARACEACRASKSRCIYLSDREICQRCAESGGSCIVRAKARPMRTKAPRIGSGSLASTKVLLELPALPSRNIHQDIEELNAHHRRIFGDEEGQNSRSTAPQDVQPLIQPRKITLDEAAALLSTYKTLAPSFPFVRVPKAATVPLMSRESPILLLAMLIAASRSRPNLHHQLAHEFRRVLSQEIVMEGKKNLDLLQGLLVYVAWYPIHSNPKHSQTFVFMNLAASLAFDLGLDNESPNPMSFTPVDTKGLVEGGAFTTAAKQALLGCYYMSSTLSMGFQKPTSMQYRTIIDTRGAEILQEDPSDETFYSVKLQRLWERISDFYFTRDQERDPLQSPLSPEIETEVFLNELEDFRRMTPDSVRNIAFIGLIDRLIFVAIYGYNLGLLRRSYQVKLHTENNPRIISHEYKCLEGCKIFFDYLLALPESSFITFSTLQWALVVHCTLVLSRLTFVMASDLGWDSHMTQTNIPMILYLDCLCWRFEKLSSVSQESSQSSGPVNSLYVLKVIFESLKKSYSRRLAEIRAPAFMIDQTNLGSISRGQCPLRDPDVNTYFESEYSYSSDSFEEISNSSSSTFPIYHDIWSTMTGAWAQE